MRRDTVIDDRRSECFEKHICVHQSCTNITNIKKFSSLRSHKTFAKCLLPKRPSLIHGRAVMPVIFSRWTFSTKLSSNVFCLDSFRLQYKLQPTRGRAALCKRRRQFPELLEPPPSFDKTSEKDAPLKIRAFCSCSAAVGLFDPSHTDTEKDKTSTCMATNKQARNDTHQRVAKRSFTHLNFGSDMQGPCAPRRISTIISVVTSWIHPAP